jgi:hypothetical protein
MLLSSHRRRRRLHHRLRHHDFTTLVIYQHHGNRAVPFSLIEPVIVAESHNATRVLQIGAYLVKLCNNIGRVYTCSTAQQYNRNRNRHEHDALHVTEWQYECVMKT